jgi:hypothetical protein
MGETAVRRFLAATATAGLLMGCVQGAGPAAEPSGVVPPGAAALVRGSGGDVEAPEIYQVTESALWDGRPSLGGIWVAAPDVQDPERVIMVNPATGKSVQGALFRRERDNPGPALQISSDAAEALGMLAGQPAEIRVTALRRVEPEAAPAETAPETAVAAADPAGTAADPAAAAAETAGAAATATAATAAAALDAAEGTGGPAAAEGDPAAVAVAEPPKPKTWRERRAEARAKREAERAAAAAAAAAAEAGTEVPVADAGTDPAATEAAAAPPATAAVETAPLDAPAEVTAEAAAEATAEAAAEAAPESTSEAAPEPRKTRRQLREEARAAAEAEAAAAAAAAEAPPVEADARPIQVASFTRQENAQRAVDALAKIGISAEPRKFESGGKVVWGVVAMGNEAKLKAIKGFGFADAFFLQ